MLAQLTGDRAAGAGLINSAQPKRDGKGGKMATNLDFREIHKHTAINAVI
jgi:hypothetical protein